MSQVPDRRWQCRACLDYFPSRSQMDKHIHSCKVRKAIELEESYREENEKNDAFNAAESVEELKEWMIKYVPECANCY